MENFEREKRDLSFVVFFEIKVAVAMKPTACYAFNRRHLDHREVIGLKSMVPDKIVPT